MVLHAPSLHFHIGSWFVTAVCTNLALFINYFQKRGLLYFNKRIEKDIVNKLDFTAHISGIIGLVGIFAASYLGLIDAAGVDYNFSFLTLNETIDSLLFFLDFSIPIQGFEKSIANQLLGYKVIWAFVGIQFYLVSGIIRFYFVTLKKIKFPEVPLRIQLIYSGAALFGYIIMVAVAGTGGMYTYNRTILEDVPLVQNLLPGYQIPLLAIFTVLFGLFVIIMLISFFFARKKQVNN